MDFTHKYLPPQWELEKLTRLTETEKTRHFLLLRSLFVCNSFLSRNNFSLLRERLGIDRPLVVAASGTQILDKREKEAVNLVARASGEGRAIVRPHPAKDPFEPWEMTAQEREVANKYVRLIQYHCPTR